MQPDAFLQQAQRAMADGHPQQALDWVSRGLEAWPDDAQLGFWAGVLQAQCGQPDAGLERLRSLLDGHSPAEWLRAGLQLALTLQDEAWLTAAQAWGSALCRRPQVQAVDRYMLGCVLARLQQDAQAEQVFRQALEQQPSLTQAHHELALCLHRQQRSAEALQHFAACGPLEVKQPWFHYNHALSLQAEGRMTQALEALDRALALDDAFLDARLRRAEILAREADWDALTEERECIGQALDRGTTAANTSPYSADVIGLDARHQRRLACGWAARAGRPASLATGPARCVSGRPVRVAYFGGDLNLSAVGSLLDAIWASHDPDAVTVLGITSHATGDWMEARLRNRCAHWLDVSGCTDREAAERIHALEADVLLDVSGYTRRGRPGVLAHRPVVRQWAFLGYLNRHCAPFIDELVADPCTAAGLPPDWDEPLRLHPACLLPPALAGDLAGGPVPSRQALGLPDQARVLASFNAVYKLNPALLDAWAEILNRDRDAVLWLGGAGSPAAWSRIRQALEQRGVAPSRLFAAPALPLREHLARLRQADLWLDSFPYNGGAGVVAAHSAGLPVQTLLGQGLLGRMSAALNRALGDEGRVADSRSAYVEQACLVDDPARPVLDIDGWTRQWEAVLRAACAG